MLTAIDEERITMEELLKEHEEMLASIPNGVAHDTANCTLCNLAGEPAAANDIDESERGDMSKTYTEEEFNAAVAAALEPLQAQLDAIKQTETEKDIEARIQAAVESVEAEKAELQNSLDTALVEATEAKDAYTTLTSYLEAEETAAREAQEYAALKEQRLEQVKEVASFSDEHVNANADRWAKMSDEDFDAVISDWKAVAEAAAHPVTEKQEENKIPAATAMIASREESQGSDKFAGARQLMRAGLTGNDPRTL